MLRLPSSAEKTSLFFTPMLDEVAAGDLEPAHICNPLRKLLRHVTVLSGENIGAELTDWPIEKKECGYERVG
jgi:NADH dehydrogenase FAD-containing subunit